MTSSKKTVVITGASGGIGTELIKSLFEQNWTVIATDHPSQKLSDESKRRCQNWIPADLQALAQKHELLEKFTTEIASELTDTECMAIVHNAAVQKLGNFEGLSAEDWSTTFEVNVLAPVLISRSLLPFLKERYGSIVHIGSIHSQLTKPGFTAYAASKAALAGLTKAMAVELGGVVRVNAIEPAAIETPMLNAGFEKTPGLKAELESFHPTGSIGQPQDVSNAVIYLLDPANKFLNGCVLALGGGIHNRLHDPV